MSEIDRIEALLALGRDQEAAVAAEEGLGQDPDNAPLLLLLARARLGLDRDDAIGPARRAVELRPDDPEALAVLGRTMLARGDPRNALTAAERVIELAPVAPVGHVLRALVFYGNAVNIGGRSRRRQLDEARASAQRAVELAPRFAEAHTLLGHIERAAGNRAAADRHAHDALRLEADSGSARGLLGELAEDRGDIRAAGDHFVSAGRAGDGAAADRLREVGVATMTPGDWWRLIGVGFLVFLVARILIGTSPLAGWVLFLAGGIGIAWWIGVGHAQAQRRKLSDEAARLRRELDEGP